MKTDIETINKIIGSLESEIFEKRELDEREILRCTSGSRAYGLATPESDYDYKGIYIETKGQCYGINPTKKTKRFSEDDLNFSLRHFIKLALKCQPNILEVLYCENSDMLFCSDEGKLLRDNRDLFLSKKCLGAYVGYARGQMINAAKKGSNRGQGRLELIEQFGYDSKFAMHTIRLLQTAEEILTEKQLKVIRPNRDFLLGIRSGKTFTCYDEFRTFALELIEKIEKIAIESDLKEKPDINQINELSIILHEQYWKKRGE